MSTKTLLTLDDEVLALEAIQIAMGGRKYKLFLASSFQKAVQILENEEIDGAMMDINLQTTDHDGVEFLSLSKEVPGKAGLSCFGLPRGAYGSEMHQARCGRLLGKTFLIAKRSK